MEEIDSLTLHKATKKEKHACTRLYERYAPQVWKQVYQTVHGDTDAAREIVQETFIRVFKNIGTFRNNCALSTWIYRIAFNTAMSHLRTRQRINGREASIDIADNARAPSYEERATVRAILETMSPRDRYMLIAHEITGLSYDEIAEVTDKSAGAIRTALHRLKSRIQKDFAHEMA